MTQFFSGYVRKVFGFYCSGSYRDTLAISGTTVSPCIQKANS